MRVARNIHGDASIAILPEPALAVPLTSAAFGIRVGRNSLPRLIWNRDMERHIVMIAADSNTRTRATQICVMKRHSEVLRYMGCTFWDSPLRESVRSRTLHAPSWRATRRRDAGCTVSPAGQQESSNGMRCTSLTGA